MTFSSGSVFPLTILPKFRLGRQGFGFFNGGSGHSDKPALVCCSPCRRRPTWCSRTPHRRQRRFKTNTENNGQRFFVCHCWLKHILINWRLIKMFNSFINFNQLAFD